LAQFPQPITLDQVSHEPNLLPMLPTSKYCWQLDEAASRFCPLCFSNLSI